MSDTENLTPVETFLCPRCDGTKGKDEYIGRTERHVFDACRECGGSGMVFRKREHANENTQKVTISDIMKASRGGDEKKAISEFVSGSKRTHILGVEVDNCGGQVHATLQILVIL